MRPSAARPPRVDVLRRPAAAPPGGGPARQRTAPSVVTSVLAGGLVGALVVGLGAGAAAAAAPDSTLTVTGTVRVVLPEVTGDGPAAEVRTLVEADGVLHDLTGHPAVADVATGSDVVLTLEADRGRTPADALAAVAEATGTDTRAPDGTAELVRVAPVHEAGTTAVRDAVVTGRHTLTVLPVYGSRPDGQTRQTLTARVEGVARYWSDQTGGRITFGTSVREWARYDEPATCEPDAIWNNAMAAHGNPPVSATQHVLVYFPYRDCRGWDGLATVGGGQIWLNGSATEDVVAHELGHNLGLGHANTLTCGPSAARASLAGEYTGSYPPVFSRCTPGSTRTAPTSWASAPPCRPATSPAPVPTSSGCSRRTGSPPRPSPSR
ncbi:hypothetical protein [Cellulomonas sp. ATA003]|uniref:hypothetical protein n=1 Tax=Cellulomonas sp. ATA003 TaxID=3073064 RepID=UPI0028735987|nr:hypothetical protein [Cellulomonas sp. ATA003]WNB86326.1 hypothetical protein REH70_03475 [Cellulomonas sp. ATA003]